MVDAKHLVNDIMKQLKNCIPPGVSQLTEDVEKNVRSVLQNTFSKMDLVTREEFEAQSKVLARTRAKLEQLEKQLEELEKHK